MSTESATKGDYSTPEAKSNGQSTDPAANGAAVSGEDSLAKYGPADLKAALRAKRKPGRAEGDARLYTPDQEQPQGRPDQAPETAPAAPAGREEDTVAAADDGSHSSSSGVKKEEGDTGADDLDPEPSPRHSPPWFHWRGRREAIAKALQEAREARARVNTGTSTATASVGCRVSGGSVLAFPVEVFPKKIQTFITAAAKALPCPPDYLGTMALPTLATFIGRKRSIEVKPGWTEFPLLWTCVVGPSGDRKSPAFSIATGPLRQKQRELKADFDAALARYNALPADQQKQQTKPRLKQVLTTNATIEGLRDALKANPNGIIFAADELSGWAKGQCQYKGGKGDDRQTWLSIWSSAQLVYNRVGKETIIIDDPFVSITGGIQPSCLGDLIDDAREDGSGARILFSYPDSSENTDWTEDTVKGVEDYAKLCEALWVLSVSTVPDTFSKEAKKVWVDWVNAHRKEEPPDELRPAWSKMEGYCARLALVLYLARFHSQETKESEIDKASVEGAIKLVCYFKSHAQRAYAHTADLRDDGRIGQFLRWARRQAAAGREITARLVQRHEVCKVKTADDARALLNDAADLGHGTVTCPAADRCLFTLRGHPTPDTRQSDG